MERVVGTMSLATVAGTVFGFLLVLGAIAHGSDNYMSFLSIEGFLIVFGGTIANGLGTVALTTSGSGTQVLTGSSTYTGPTTIASGTLNQATALRQVDTAMREMDAVTRENARMVEDGTQSIRHLAAEASRLRDHIGQFRIELTAETAPPMRARRAALGVGGGQG